MIKLSIIVPIYNVEPYLRKCVDSLLAQDYQDYEIILVDDGSTDNSGVICDEYASLNSLTHSRINSLPEIRVIHQKNGGLSAARNTGIAVARGEYIMFVDSDDYIEPNVLGGLLAQAERERLDVLRFDYLNVRVVDGKYEVFQPYKEPHLVDKRSDIVDGKTYLNERMGYECYAVMYIIKQSLLIKELGNDGVRELGMDCLFTEGIHYEDVDWLPRMILRAKRVNSTTTIVYNYLIRQGSITKTQGDKTKIRKNIEDQLTVMQRYSQLINQYSDCIWLRNMQSSIVAGVLTTIAREFYKERNAYITRLRGLDVFPLAITNQGRTYVLRAKIINLFGPQKYCAIMRLRKYL